MGATNSSEKPLPLRRTEDGVWEVETPPGKWTKCETESDARTISNAPLLEEKACYGTCPDQTLAAELRATADILEKYGFGWHSRFFRSRAEDMRGDGSDVVIVQ
jgi:hypothetical protein